MYRSSAVDRLLISICAVSIFALPRYFSTCGVATATSKPRMASTTSSSTSVKPASRRPSVLSPSVLSRAIRFLNACMIISLHREVVDAHHRRQNGADHARDDEAEHDGEKRAEQGQHPGDAAARFGFENIGDLEQHLLLPAAFLADADEVDGVRRGEPRPQGRLSVALFGAAPRCPPAGLGSPHSVLFALVCVFTLRSQHHSTHFYSSLHEPLSI